MKQAILITAYKNYSHLKKIINFFDEDFQIYVHLDRKSKISPEEIDVFVTNNKVKFFCRKYKVNWGGLNHLKSILFLAKEALKDENNFYFHLISGQDFPIRSCEDFKSFFQINSIRNYIDHFEVPFSGWGGNGGLDRLSYFNFYDLFDAKKMSQSRWITKTVKAQKKIGYERALPKTLSNLYGGSTWWSLNREAVDHCITFTLKNKGFLNRFKHTFCSEEFYFQTILMNSGLKDSMLKDNLRFIDWQKNNGASPAILGMADLTKLNNSNAFFARKFESSASLKLLASLEERLKQEVL